MTPPSFLPTCPDCRVIYFRGGYTVRFCGPCQKDAQESISCPERLRGRSVAAAFVDDVLTSTKEIDA